MDAASEVSPKQFSESLRHEMEAFLESVMQAVNEATDGEWISGSEEQVRTLSAEFREQVFQQAVQQRIDAAEAAFPPPPEETVTDPVTKQPVTKRLANKGRQSTHVLTINGRIVLRRRWWHSASEGSAAPADTLIDRRGQTVTCGVVEMAARLNNDGTSFDSAAENLARTAQIKISGEQLRKLIITAGQSVLSAQQSASIPTAFQATDCPADPANPSGPTRIYTGVDGVMVPTITDAEKIKRRTAIKRKRQRSGKKCRPLPPRRQGTDEKFKEFKVVVFYDETGKHWHEVLTRRRWHAVGSLVRREARRLNFKAADEKIANVDGATRIRNQLEARPHELPLDGLGLDFYHLAENVHKSRRIVFGENSDEGRAWSEKLLHTLKHEGYQPAAARLGTIAELASPAPQRRKKSGGRPLDQLRAGASRDDQRSRVPKAWLANRQWSDAVVRRSGPTESRCKTSTSRLKGRGRRWNMRNAEAVAALTTLKDSNQWHLVWQTPDTAQT